MAKSRKSETAAEPRKRRAKASASVAAEGGQDAAFPRSVPPSAGAANPRPRPAPIAPISARRHARRRHRQPPRRGPSAQRPSVGLRVGRSRQSFLQNQKRA